MFVCFFQFLYSRARVWRQNTTPSNSLSQTWGCSRTNRRRQNQPEPCRSDRRKALPKRSGTVSAVLFRYRRRPVQWSAARFAHRRETEPTDIINIYIYIYVWMIRVCCLAFFFFGIETSATWFWKRRHVIVSGFILYYNIIYFNNTVWF